MERRSRRPLVNRIQINFIHEHERANTPSDVANFTQNRVWCKRARRIVQVRDHDEPRLLRNGAKNLSGIDYPASLLGAQKSLHIRAKVLGHVENGSIRWMFN